MGVAKFKVIGIGVAVVMGGVALLVVVTRLSVKVNLVLAVAEKSK